MTLKTTHLSFRLQLLLAASIAACVGVFAAVVMECIKPQPDNRTRVADATELARIETQKEIDSSGAKIASAAIPPDSGTTPSLPQERLADDRGPLPSPQTNSSPGEGKRHLKYSKRYRLVQRQNPIAVRRPQLAQQNSFFSMIGRALGLSTNVAKSGDATSSLAR
jgi:hypothetical protein